MAGLQKQKQYDWKDSNLALFGSDTEKQVKKESAEMEPAWRVAGVKPGLQVWRIVKFKVTVWPKEEYGKFYDGDSYIILNTYKKEDSDALLYDVHFWIGKYSSQDEYGTAAYKTVELDTYLNDVPIQHREVQEHESKLFKSYFPEITYLKGGADSGFNHVKPENYTPRLFHFHGDRKGVTITEIRKSKDNLDENDVYILDLGLTIYQWNGRGSSKEERFRALQYVSKLKSDRTGKAVKSQVMDQSAHCSVCVSEPDEDEGSFLNYLNEDKDTDGEKENENGMTHCDGTHELYRLSDATGTMEFSMEKKGDITMGDFESEDVFIFDTKQELFVWIGHQTTREEQKNAMSYAHNYLQKTDHPLIPVSCLKEGSDQPTFHSALAA